MHDDHITLFFFCLFHSLTLTNTQRHWVWIFTNHPPPPFFFFFQLRCILWEPSLRTVLVSWLSGRAPWLPLNCKLLRWENQVGGNLRKRNEQSSVIFYKEKVFFPCVITEVVGSLKRSRPGFSANIPVKTNKHGKQNLQVCSSSRLLILVMENNLSMVCEAIEHIIFKKSKV